MNSVKPIGHVNNGSYTIGCVDLREVELIVYLMKVGVEIEGSIWVLEVCPSYLLGHDWEVSNFMVDETILGNKSYVMTSHLVIGNGLFVHFILEEYYGA